MRPTQCPPISICEPQNFWKINVMAFRVHSISGILLSLWVAAASAQTAAKPDEGKQVQLQGRVVCLPEEMNRVHGTELPTPHAHIYGFKAADGTYYTLLRTKLSEALFMDERLRKKELLLKGRVLPKSQVFDVGTFKSLVNGKVCDLYYWCDI